MNVTKARAGQSGRRTRAKMASRHLPWIKPIIISRLEWVILLMFAIAMTVDYFFLHLGYTRLSILYFLGMMFEFFTEAAWDYNPVLYKSTFTLRDRDVNWIFGLGWVGTLVLGLSLGKLFLDLDMPAWIASALGIGIVGNIMEEIFLKLGLWKYNEKNWIVSLGLKKSLMIGKIPLTVRLGYFLLMGTLIPFAVKYF